MNETTQTSAASPGPQQTLGDPKKAKAANPQQIGPKRLALLWGILLLGYFLFVVQWYSITNFQGGSNLGQVSGGVATVTSPANGWGAAFFLDVPPTSGVQAIENSSTNWMITFGRAIGSILAGYLVAKIGHKYAVVTVLGLMVIAFPFIIIGQNAGWNSLSVAGGAPMTPFQTDPTYNTAAAGFALFVVFRTFLAIGGTTLITYTNAIIARMEPSARPKFMTFNNFGFNGGAFFASIFFVIPGATAKATDPATWTGILSFFIVLSLVLMVTYLFIGVEMVPPRRKQHLAQAANATSFGKVFKEKDTWRMSPLFGIWLISVVFSTSGTMKGWALPSAYDYAGNLSGMDQGNVWNMFTCMFVAGFVAALFTVARYGNTIFNRKAICHAMFAAGYVLLLCSYMCGKYGHAAPGAIAGMMILSFASGFFLWGVQPVLLMIPQQMSKSTPEYVGIVAGLIWGVGYFTYTCGDVLMNCIASFAPKNAQGGSDGMFIAFWIVCALIFALIPLLPDSGYRKSNGEFVVFTKKWNPLKLSHWNTANPENSIKVNAAR